MKYIIGDQDSPTANDLVMLTRRNWYDFPCLLILN